MQQTITAKPGRTLSPLALLLLAACGGGGGGGPVSFTRDGKVIKGPLEGAKAFLDYDGDGEHDSNEPMVRTDSDGSYTLTGSSTFSNATLVAIADEQTVDTSSGVVLSGITLKAPASAEVVSIASTIYQDAFEAAAEAGGSAPSADDIAALLGIDTAALPDGKDIFSFNPYDDPTSAASKSVEAASQQIAAVLTSIAAVADATGGDAVDSSKAFEAALSSVTKVFTDSIGSVDTSNSAAVATFLADTVVAQAVTEVKSTVETAVNDYYQAQVDAGTITADQKQAAVVKSAKSFDAVEDTVVTSVKAVTAAIKTAVDSGLSLSDSSVKDVFSVTSSLTSQITTAATESAAKVNELIDNAIARGTAVADLATNDALEAEITGATAAINNNAVTIKDAASVATVAANKAPTDISLTNADSENTIQFSEGAASLVIGSLTTTDTETLDQTKFKYTIGGDDALDANGNAQFAISSDGVLSFVSKPDYETKSEYSIAIKSEDEAGKSRSEVYTIKITDVDENAFDAGFQVTTDSATGADAALTDYIYASQTGQVQADEVSIDLGSAGSALTFAAITLDLNNINNGLSSSAAHQSSVVGIPIQKVPVIKGSTQEQKITVKLTEGSDGARASGEREIELSFDVVLTGSGSNFAITPKAVDGSYIVDISYINSSDTEYPAVEMTATSNNTLSYSGGVLSVQLFDLLTQIPESIVPNSVLGSGGTFYATISGLPFLDEDGTSLSTIEGQIVIEDRNAPPALQGPDAGSVTEDASPFVLGTLEASDIEQDVITYGVKGASGTVTELLGSYGTLTVNSSTGSYRYELDNANSVVNALDVGGVLTETFTVVATATGGSTEKLLSVTINGANDQPGAISLSADTITENELGAVVGTLSAVDPEGNTLTYTLTNFGNGAEFEIVSGNQLKLRDDIAADYDVTGGEQKTVKITVKDGDGRTPVETELNININNINEQPILEIPISTTIFEDGGLYEYSTTLTASDPEGSKLIYKIINEFNQPVNSIQTSHSELTVNSETGNILYSIDNTSSKIQNLGLGDFFTETFLVRAETIDGFEQSQLREMSVVIFGANDPPQNLSINNLVAEIDENVMNVTFGEVTASDPDGDRLYIEIKDDLDALVIGQDGKSIVLKDGFSFDAETHTQLKYSVSVSDGIATGEITEIISINNINEPPIITEGSVLSFKSSEDIEVNFNQIYLIDPEGSPVKMKISRSDGTLSTFENEAYALFQDSLGSLEIFKDREEFKYTLNTGVPELTQLAQGDELIVTYVITAESDGMSSEEMLLDLRFIGLNDAPFLNPEVSFGTVELTQDEEKTITLPENLIIDYDTDDFLTYSFLPANTSVPPDWFLFNAEQNTIKFTPNNDSVGRNLFTFKGTDTLGLSLSTSIEVIVTNTNDNPFVDIENQLSDLSVYEDELIIGDFSIYFDDVDLKHANLDKLTYSAELNGVSDIPDWFDLDNSTGKYSLKAPNSFVGINDINIFATDLFGASVSNQFQLKVENTNDAPQVKAEIPDLIVFEDEYFSLDLSDDYFDDVDVGDDLTISVNQENGSILPHWLNFDSNSFILSGTPLDADVTDIPFNIRVAATDSKEVVTDVFQLSVANTNDPPQLIASQGKLTFTEDYPYTTYSLSTSMFIDDDIDSGDELEYEVKRHDGEAIPSWLKFNAENMTFSGVPLDEHVGTFQLRLIATDLEGEAAETAINIEVLETNEAPELVNELPNYTINDLEPFSFLIPENTFFDEEGDALRYSYTHNDTDLDLSWLVLDSQTGRFSGELHYTALDAYKAANIEEVDISVVAADAFGRTAKDVFTLSFENSNQAPIAQAPMTDLALDAGDERIIQLSNFFFDPDAISFGDVLTYSALMSDGSAIPNWMFLDQQSGSIKFAPTMLVDAGEYTLSYSAADLSDEKSVSTLLNVTVSNEVAKFIVDPASVNRENGQLIDYPSGGDPVSQDVKLTLETPESEAAFFFLGSLNFDYENFSLGKQGSASFKSPKLSLPLELQLNTQDTVELGEIKISVIDRIENGTNSPRIRDTGEREAVLTYQAKIDVSDLLPEITAVTDFDHRGRQFDAKATYVSGSGTSISSSEAGITNNTVVYDHNNTLVQINFLDILDDFAVSRYIPLERGEYYMTITGLPFATIDNEDVLSVEANVTLI